MPWIEHTHPEYKQEKEQTEMKPGTYAATASAATVWESDGGALMITFVFNTTEGERINGAQCLVQKDGTVSERTLKTLKECFGWDGLDPFWLTDPANLDGKEVDIVCEEETFTGRDKQPVTAVKVKWINPPGGAGNMPTPADPKAVMAKYASKFKALSGGKPAAAPKKAAAPAAPKAPAKKAPAAPSAPAPTSTMEEVWALCAEGHGDKAEEVWFATIKRVTGKEDGSTVTPEEWGRLKAAFEDNVPY
jgi:hypothetical protein